MKKTFVILFTLASVYGCVTRNYTQVMQKSTKKVLGDDFKHYDFFSYPTDNYGVATCYFLESTAPNFECDTWNCLGIKPLPSDFNALLSLNDFAAVGTGPVITLTEKVKREIAIKAILPEVFNTLGVSLDASGTGIRTIDMSFGPGHVRNLRRQEFSNHLTALPSNQRLSVFFASGELVYVFSDVVLENFTVSISVDNSLQSQLDAKLAANPALGTFTGSSLDVKLSKNAQGKYTLSSTKPLIVARWTKKVSGPGVLNDANSGTDYSVIMHLTK
jgi:hypothetical protein